MTFYSPGPYLFINALFGFFRSIILLFALSQCTALVIEKWKPYYIKARQILFNLIIAIGVITTEFTINIIFYTHKGLPVKNLIEQLSSGGIIFLLFLGLLLFFSNQVVSSLSLNRKKVVIGTLIVAGLLWFISPKKIGSLRYDSGFTKDEVICKCIGKTITNAKGAVAEFYCLGIPHSCPQKTNMNVSTKKQAPQTAKLEGYIDSPGRRGYQQIFTAFANNKKYTPILLFFVGNQDQPLDLDSKETRALILPDYTGVSGRAFDQIVIVQGNRYEGKVCFKLGKSLNETEEESLPEECYEMPVVFVNNVTDKYGNSLIQRINP